MSFARAPNNSPPKDQSNVSPLPFSLSRLLTYRVSNVEIKGYIDLNNQFLKNPGGNFQATSKTALPIKPIWLIFLVNGLDWQCCLLI